MQVCKCLCGDEYISGAATAVLFALVTVWEKFCVENFWPGSKTKAQITVAIFGVFYNKYTAMYIICTNLCVVCV